MEVAVAYIESEEAAALLHLTASSSSKSCQGPETAVNHHN